MLETAGCLDVRVKDCLRASFTLIFTIHNMAKPNERKGILNNSHSSFDNSRLNSQSLFPVDSLCTLVAIFIVTLRITLLFFDLTFSVTTHTVLITSLCSFYLVIFMKFQMVLICLGRSAFEASVSKSTGNNR